MNEEFAEAIERYKARTFHMGRCIAALRIEVKTGLKHSRGSVLQMGRIAYGIKARSKVDALKALEALYLEETGEEYGRNREYWLGRPVAVSEARKGVS